MKSDQPENYCNNEVNTEEKSEKDWEPDCKIKIDTVEETSSVLCKEKSIYARLMGLEKMFKIFLSKRD